MPCDLRHTYLYTRIMRVFFFLVFLDILFDHISLFLAKTNPQHNIKTPLSAGIPFVVTSPIRLLERCRVQTSVYNVRKKSIPGFFFFRLKKKLFLTRMNRRLVSLSIGKKFWAFFPTGSFKYIHARNTAMACTVTWE